MSVSEGALKRHGRGIGMIACLFCLLQSLTMVAKLRLDKGATTKSISKKASSETVPVIGYAIALTSCNIGMRGLLDGAAVLQRSIHLSSIRAGNHSKYDYHTYAFVHPSAKECAPFLEAVGYDVQLRETPIQLKDVRNPVLRKSLPGARCCGEKEFIKLYAYTLEQHPVVVHFDVDMLVLKPMDELFDVLLQSDDQVKTIPSAMWNSRVEHPVNAFITRDYELNVRGWRDGYGRNPINLGRDAATGPLGRNRTIAQVGVQGGFLVVKPDRKVFDEYIDIILDGHNYTLEWGWGGPEAFFGDFWDAAAIQGLVAYYYGHLHKNTSVELNPCYYNNIQNRPWHRGQCTTGRSEKECQDCRFVALSKVHVAHFNNCGKPWLCKHPPDDRSLCEDFLEQWGTIRRDLEKLWNTSKEGDPVIEESDDELPEELRLHCRKRKEYIPMLLPFLTNDTAHSG